jgi:small conductance mechanosensitive channel
MNMEKIIEVITLWATTYAIKIVAAILIFLIGKWIARKIASLFTKLMEKNNIDITLVKFLDSIMYYILLIVVIIAAAGQLGINTTMHTPDNQKVIVPNSKITSDVITNVTANETRRVDLVIGISYDDDITKAKDLLKTIIKEEQRILESPATTIAVSELADSSVNFVVRPWVKKTDYWGVYYDLIEKIKITFDREEIHIPYPQRDVHLFSEQKTG